MKNNNYNLKKGILCIFIATIAFSTIEIVAKTIHGIDPLQMNFIRFFIGGIFLLPFALKELHKRKLKLTLNDFLFFALTGIIGVTISMCFFQTAVVFTKASIVAVIFSTNPIFTAPLAFLLLKEKLNVSKILSLAVSIIGVLLIFNPFSINPDLKGMLFALISAICFSLYTVISKKRIAKYGGLILSTFSFLIGVTVLLLFLLLIGKPIVSGISLTNILPLLYLGIFASGIGYLSYFTAMKYTSAITASTVFFIKPALASILSFFILGEHLSFIAIIGIGLIIVASVIMLAPKKVDQASI